MTELVIGMGEVGTAIASLLPDDTLTHDITRLSKPPKADVLHICFPYSDNFVDAVQAYKKETGASMAIVYSTVPVGTCKQIPAIHSPVEGKHPNLAEHIRYSVRWLGSNEQGGLAMAVAVGIWKGRAAGVREVASSDYTEFLKLRSTAKYGINLVWTDYEKQVADRIGMDFSLVKEFDIDYNKTYIADDKVQRYILDPPGGKIGGHCLVPNAEMLDDQYPSDLLKMIKAMK